MTPPPQRHYFVRSPDGQMIFGLDEFEAAKAAALDYGEGAHLIDTLAQAYHPVAQKVRDGELVYLPVGGWDTGRFSLERDLIEAIKKGNAAIVHAFLAKGADSNAVDRNGGPALHWAVAKGNIEVVGLLIAHGADPATRDADGDTACDIAEARERDEIAVLLRQTGAYD